MKTSIDVRLEKSRKGDLPMGLLVLPLFPTALAKGAYPEELERAAKKAQALYSPRKRIDAEVISGSPQSRILRFSCLGPAREKGRGYSREEWKRLGGDAMRHLVRLEHLLGKSAELSVFLPPTSEIASVGAGDSLSAVIEAIVEGALLSQYVYEEWKSQGSLPKVRRILRVVLPEGVKNTVFFQEAIERARCLAEAVCFARDLVNAPPSAFPPSGFVQVAKEVARRAGSKVKLEVFSRVALKRMGAGGILGISQGSEEPPFLLHLRFRPTISAKKRAPRRVVLVGKGVTFDSGGLSIKTRPGMEAMKCDMAGGAAVLATLLAVSQKNSPFRLKRELHIIIPTAENMISGGSIKPGDVVRTVGGKTVEILNVDAEGRMLLADAFGYAEKLKPEVLIDLATLTGACVAALGSDYAGYFSDDEQLGKTIEEIGREEGEPIWRLPLATEYKDHLKSSVADLKNMGIDGGPGAIAAALFLKEFVPEDTSWVHIDMAGPAFFASEKEYTQKGASGYGVMTLVSLLERLSQDSELGKVKAEAVVGPKLLSGKKQKRGKRKRK